MTFDLNDPKLFLRADVLEDPRPLYDELRRSAPVWRLPGQRAYFVSCPELVREAVGRPEEFSSNLVSLLHDDGAGCPVAFPMAPPGSPIHVLATADPPLHTQHRKLLQPHLRQTVVATLEPALRTIVDEHLDPLLEARRDDFVAAFSDPVPAAAICTAIGLPRADARRLVRVVAATGALLDGVTDLAGMGRAATAAMELGVYAHDQLQATLARPRSERSGLLAALADGIASGLVDEGQVMAILVVLISAGSETTSSLLATAVETLARDQELQQRLRREPAAIPPAIEDFLRENGPFQFHYRWTTTDTHLGGCEIPAGSLVLLGWAAANRPDPDTSAPETSHADPAWGPATHHAFGRGLHFCIGAPLARLEARVALERLLTRTASITLDPERPPTRRPSIFLRRHTSLHVVLAQA